MRYFLTYLLLGLSISLSAQERIDTLYYDRSGRMAASPQLADYYRVALFPADSLHSGTFKDFYPTGELRRSGQFLSIDSLDDSNSRFDREVVSFFRNGRVAEQTCYTEGRREGACRQYDDEGHLRIESFYLGGRLTGLQHTYDGQGNCRTVEYDAGRPVHDYYLLSDSTGRTLKLHLTDNSPVWDSPTPATRLVDYRDGVPWEVYYANGLTVAASHSVVRAYGKWHRIDLLIANESTVPITCTPETDLTVRSTAPDGQIDILTVWPSEAYLRKINRAQIWAAVAIGIGEALPSIGADYTVSSTTHTDIFGHQTTHTTTSCGSTVYYDFDPSSLYRIAAFGQLMQDEQQVVRMGYLKKNTIYPGEAISGFVLIKWQRGNHFDVTLRIEGADYSYAWLFDRRSSYLPE